MKNDMTEMKPEDVVRAFFNTLNSSGPEAAAEYLAEDHTSQTSPFPPQSREQWIGGMHMFLAGFPDLHESFEVMCVEGNTVRGINHTTGTHTGDFDLSPMGIGIVSATGKSAFTVHSVTFIVENGKIISTTAKPVANLGFEWVLAQLGIEIPKQG